MSAKAELKTLASSRPDFAPPRAGEALGCSRARDREPTCNRPSRPAFALLWPALSAAAGLFVAPPADADAVIDGDTLELQGGDRWGRSWFY